MNFIRRHPLRASLIILLGVSHLWAADYDLVLRGGRVVDGTGNPAFFADVAVKNGRIAAIGRIVGTATREVTVRGMVVAPGFIDVHTHAEDVEQLPLAENFVRMGVTTVVVGNCGSSGGSSAPDLPEFFHRLESNGISVNLASLIGHGTIRARAMGGSFNRPPTDAEMATMQAEVERAMKAGAIGLSTGLIYLPGTFAKTDELVALARIAAAHDGIYTTHMRDEGREILSSLQEVFRIAREAGIRAQISHLKLAGGKANWGRAALVLGAIDRARRDGLDITQDEYLYTASSTGISQLIPETSRASDATSHRSDPLADKKEMIATMKAKLKKSGRKDYSYAVIGDYPADRSLNGMNLVEATRRKFGTASLESQIELIFEIERKGGATGIFHGMCEEDLQQFLQHPNTMVASDSGVRRWQEGMPHPRGYGNSARLLARYVRELHLLRLEDAVRRMTSLPATTFRLADRGLIRPGCWADLVVFDPATVQDRATFEDPHHYASGFAWVWVNGIAVVHDDVHVGARPGMILRARSQNQ